MDEEFEIFADDTSLFSIVRDQNILKTDLDKISNWSYQWRTDFNADSSKQTQAVVFSRKILYLYIFY